MRARLSIFLMAAATAVSSLVLAQTAAHPSAEAFLDPGVLPMSWRTGGPKCSELPKWQVHEYNANFFIIRESGCTHMKSPSFI